LDITRYNSLLHRSHSRRFISNPPLAPLEEHKSYIGGLHLEDGGGGGGGGGARRVS
jgi:uncharacterized membrane protein